MLLVWNTPRLRDRLVRTSCSTSRCFRDQRPDALCARDIFDTDQTGLGYLIGSVAAGAFISSIIMTRSGMRMELPAS